MPESVSLDLDSLLDEYQKSYLNTPTGRAHLESYDRARVQAAKNWELIKEAVSRGGDYTDLVLDKLLPHKDTKYNRNRGAWVHVAPAITRDVRKWFVNKGWTREEDWPNVARSVFEFVRSATEAPANLKSACDAFGASPYTKGIQAAFLTPILNALRPDDYIIFNSKSRRTLRLLTGERYPSRIEAYPRANEALKTSLEREGAKLSAIADGEFRACDIFDEFCHWLVAIKKIGKSSSGRQGTPGKRKRIDRYDPDSAADVFSSLFYGSPMGSLGLAGDREKLPASAGLRVVARLRSQARRTRLRHRRCSRGEGQLE